MSSAGISGPVVDVLAIAARGFEIEARVHSLGLGPCLLIRVTTPGQCFALGFRSVRGVC